MSAPGQRPAGFTLLEVLLSVLILGMLAAITLPLYNSFLARNDLDIAAQRVAETYRRAQVYARAMKEDSAWSVERQSTVITLFKGTSFASRPTDFDETVTLENGITATGVTEVQYAKLTGLPNTGGSTVTVTLTTTTGQTKPVSINAQGMVDY